MYRKPNKEKTSIEPQMEYYLTTKREQVTKWIISTKTLKLI